MVVLILAKVFCGLNSPEMILLFFFALDVCIKPLEASTVIEVNGVNKYKSVFARNICERIIRTPGMGKSSLVSAQVKSKSRSHPLSPYIHLLSSPVDHQV